IAPIGVEPRSAPTGANEGQNLGGVIRQVQLDGAKRLDDVGDGRIEAGIALVPGDILAQQPAPFLFGLVEEVAVQPPKGPFEFTAVLRYEIGHRGSCLGVLAAAELDTPRSTWGIIEVPASLSSVPRLRVGRLSLFHGLVRY